jgi:hypothetical protein
MRNYACTAVPLSNGCEWVQTYTYDIDSHLVFNSGKHQEKGTVYIIQQHCNRGTLIDAGKQSWNHLCTPASVLTCCQWPALSNVFQCKDLRCCLELVVRYLQYSFL